MEKYVITVKKITKNVEAVNPRWERMNALPDSPFGYTPSVDQEVERFHTIYEQTVDYLSMTKLVGVINNFEV